MNLDRCVKKQNIMQRHLYAWCRKREICHINGKKEIVDDVSMLQRFSSHDGGEYSDTRTLIKAAIDDGFEAMKTLYPNGNGRGNGTIAWLWTYRSVLRQIIESGLVTFILVDDWFPLASIEEFNRILRLVPEETFKLIQFHCWYYEPEKRTEEEIVQLKKECPDIFGWLKREGVHIFEGTPELYEGIVGLGDSAMIFSPEGAQYMLEWMDEYPEWCPENVIYFTIPKHPSGCYSVTDIQDWVEHQYWMDRLDGDKSDRELLDEQSIGEFSKFIR